MSAPYRGIFLADGADLIGVVVNPPEDHSRAIDIKGPEIMFPLGDRTRSTKLRA